MNATQAIYFAAGSPPADGDTEGICRVCGQPGTGQPFTSWVRRTFTDHDLMLPGDIVCHACLFSFEERSEQLARLVGKEKPQRMRNYSHFVLRGEWRPLSKGDKDGMIAVLAQEPEVAVVALSGQKHLIFRAKAGWWQIEEQAAVPSPDKLWCILGIVELLYSSGFSKGEIESGRYKQHRIRDVGLSRWKACEAVIAPMRGTLPMQLAVFLAQRRELVDGKLSEGIPYGAEAAMAAVARHTGGLQTGVRPQHLGAVRGQHPGGGVHEQSQQVRQLDLFEAEDNDSR